MSLLSPCVLSFVFYPCYFRADSQSPAGRLRPSPGGVSYCRRVGRFPEQRNVRRGAGGPHGDPYFRRCQPRSQRHSSLSAEVQYRFRVNPFVRRTKTPFLIVKISEFGRSEDVRSLTFFFFLNKQQSRVLVLLVGSGQNLRLVFLGYCRNIFTWARVTPPTPTPSLYFYIACSLSLDSFSLFICSSFGLFLLCCTHMQLGDCRCLPDGAHDLAASPLIGVFGHGAPGAARHVSDP